MSWSFVAVSECVIGLLGLTLIANGVRGRRVSDHPFCRRCKYDLTGIYAGGGTNVQPSASPGALRCPECGSSLRGRRRIMHGRRVRRWTILAVGLVSVLMAGGSKSVRVWQAVKVNGWASVKPTWLLVMEARHSVVNYRALDELLRRSSQGRLAQSTEKTLIAFGLNHAWVWGTAWSNGWQSLLDHSYGKGFMTPAQKAEYALRSSPFTAKLNDSWMFVANVGTILSVEPISTRFGFNPLFEYRLTLVSARFDEAAPLPRQDLVIDVNRRASVSGGLSVAAPQLVGLHRLQTEWDVEVFEAGATVSGAQIAIGRLALPVMLIVTPPPQRFTVPDDSTLRARVINGLSLEYCALIDDGLEKSLIAHVQLPQFNDGVFQCFFVQGALTYGAGLRRWYDAPEAIGLNLQGSAPALTEQPVNIVLQAAQIDVQEALDPDPAWDGAITLRDVQPLRVRCSPRDFANLPFFATPLPGAPLTPSAP